MPRCVRGGPRPRAAGYRPPMAAIELDAIEQRVIGSLLEKERTVPDTYPMTLNGVRTACNQTSGRDPVLSLGELEVQAGLDRLRAQGLTRVVHPSHGARTPKHRQVLDEVLGLDAGGARRRHPPPPAGRPDARRAPVAVGSPPRLRLARPGATPRSTCWRCATTRSSRSCPASRVRRRLGGSTASARRTGGPTPTTEAGVVPHRVRRGTRRSSRPTTPWPPRTPTSSSTSSIASRSTAGCSSGSPSRRRRSGRRRRLRTGTDRPRYLAMAGADVTGFDLSPGMVDEARRRFPDLPFEVADLTAAPARRLGGHHELVLARAPRSAGAAGSDRGPGRLAPARRLARPRGARGRRRRATSTSGSVTSVDLDFSFHRRDDVLTAVEAAGFEEVEWYVRGPTGPEATDGSPLRARSPPVDLNRKEANTVASLHDELVRHAECEVRSSGTGHWRASRARQRVEVLGGIKAFGDRADDHVAAWFVERSVADLIDLGTTWPRRPGRWRGAHGGSCPARRRAGRAGPPRDGAPRRGWAGRSACGARSQRSS